LQFRRGCCNAAGDVGAKPFEWAKGRMREFFENAAPDNPMEAPRRGLDMQLGKSFINCTEDAGLPDRHPWSRKS